MSAVYAKQGLHFEYPENWELDESSAAEGEVSVYSPGGGFWTVIRCGHSADPMPYADSTLAAIREEYEQLDAEPMDEIVVGHRLSGFDVNFFCLDLTNTLRIRAVRTAEVSLLILCQAEDSEFERISPVFAAMTNSLLSHAVATKAATWP